MSERVHDYATTVTWIGSSAGSTGTYAGYSREHTVAFDGKDVVLRGSADPAFRGDRALVNPEEMLVASLSACHLLSYLAVCALEKIKVVSYVDRAIGMMSEEGGKGQFVGVTLRPQVGVAKRGMVERALALHGAAHEACFIANSVNFLVRVDPTIVVADEAQAQPERVR